MTLLINRRRLSRVAGFTSAQLAVQFIGFASGVVLVRCLEPAQYGHYTLSMSMVGLANVMLDLGLSTAVLANGGPILGDRERLAGLIGDAWVMQRRLALGGAFVLIPAFAAMFAWQGLATFEIVCLVLGVIGATAFTVRNAIALAVVRLNGALAMQQWLEIGINFAKLLVILVAALFYVDAKVAVTVNFLASAAAFVILRRYLNAYLGSRIHAHAQYSAALVGFIKRQAPNSLYYCVSGQIAVWLVGLLGNSDRVGEVGALGRLALFFTVIGAVVTAFVQPYFARAAGRRDLANAFLTLNVLFLLLTATLVVAAMSIPSAMLWILGPRYAELSVELVWMVLAVSLGAWAGAIYSAGAACGWVVPALWLIPTGLIAIAMASALLDVSTVRGGFMMNTVVSAASLVVTLVFMAGRMHAMPRPQEIHT